MMYLRLVLACAFLFTAASALAAGENVAATDLPLQAVAEAGEGSTVPTTDVTADAEQAPPTELEDDAWSRESEGLQLMGACEDQCWAANAACRAQCPKKMPYFEWCMSANCWPVLDACLAAC